MSDEEPQAEPAEAERPRRKKKKKRKVAPVDVPTDAAPSESAPPPDDRPLFARAWPRDEELERLLAAFSRGNYATIRRDAPALAAKSADPAVKKAAADLRRRIDPDPLSSVLLLIAIGLLTVFAFHYLGHDDADETDKSPDKGGDRRPPTPQPTPS